MAQEPNNNSFPVTTTSQMVFRPKVLGLKRIQYSITNTDTAATVYVAKSWDKAVAGQGIVLAPNNGTVIESQDAGPKLWQGPIHIVGSASCTVAISELNDDGSGE